MMSGKICRFAAGAVVFLLLLAEGCTPAEKEIAKTSVGPEKTVVTKVEPKKTVETKVEPAEQKPTVKLALKFTPGETTTYKLTTQVQKSVLWEGPLPDKPDAFKGGHTGNKIEITFEQRIKNVRDFGAVGNGINIDTEAIQAAIDAAAENKGGTVLFPPGRYLTGTIFLKSNVTLHLAAEAIILGSTDIADYPDPPLKTEYAIYNLNKVLIYAQNCRNIALTGTGTIDGQGAPFPSRDENKRRLPRPMLIRFANCQNVKITNLTLKNAAAWCCHLLFCQDVVVNAVKIRNLCNRNNDGLDIDSCQNVFISNCDIHSGDDSIALKTSGCKPCTNITITNCILSSRCAALRYGPESSGDITNVTVSNCIIKNTFMCGIKLQAVEGGKIENLIFSNIVMDNVTGPVSMRLGKWKTGILVPTEKGRKTPSILRNVLINNIRATVPAGPQPALHFKHPGPIRPGEKKSCISLNGIPGHYIENITLSNIHVTFPGGGTIEEAARREIPELEDQYPEYFMFGILPAYGLYARHAKGITLNNVKFDLAGSDMRPAIVCDDVKDLELSGFRAQGNTQAQSLIRLQNTSEAFIHGCRPLNDINTFLRVEGLKSEEITLLGNDLSRAKSAVETANGAASQAVTTSVGSTTN